MRELYGEVQECANGSVWCWMRCMEYTTTSFYGISDPTCADKGDDYRVMCVNQFDQLYVSGHGAYTPECTNTVTEATDRDPVVQPNASLGETVTDAEWTTLTTDSSFEHSIELDVGVGNTVLMWNAAAEGPFEVKMIHRGYVGWMSLGLAHPGGGLKGMKGAPIVMGMHWDGDTLSVDEYKITECCTAFRYWNISLSESEPESVSLENASFSVGNGVSTLEFSVQSAIYKTPLNLTSSNMLNAFIWGLTQKDYCTYDAGGYCSHHELYPKDRSRRPEVRGAIWLDLSSEEMTEYMPDEEEEAPVEEDTSSSHTLQGSLLVWAAAVLVPSLIAS
jgi:hypothetical protein